MSLEFSNEFLIQPKSGDGGGGSTPVIESLSITPTTSAQTITAPSGTDGYSPISVSAVTNSIDNNITSGNIKKDVTILGVTGTYEGNIGIPREVSQGVYQFPSNNFTYSLPNNATDVGQSAFRCAFYRCSTLTSVDLSNLTSVSGTESFTTAFCLCTNLTSADLSNLTDIAGNSALGSAFQLCAALTSVDFSSLQTIGDKNATNSVNFGHFYNCFKSCTNLTTLTFPELTEIYCTGEQSKSGTFQGNDKIQKMYFPKLSVISYAPNAISTLQYAYLNTFQDCSSLTELHFGAANQAAIEANPGYSTLWGRGAGNATVYFDL